MSGGVSRRALLLGSASLALLPVTRSVAEQFELREGESGRYDTDYPALGYSASATSNRVWHLQQQLASDARTLVWQSPGGYLESLLKGLSVKVDSQVLVFSKTSLHGRIVSERTPRALFFNDDTYVGYVPGSGILELIAFDARLGPVFFTLENVDGAKGSVRRYGTPCLMCHDTYSMMGGGVPRILAMSSSVDGPPGTPDFGMGLDVHDRTSLDDRWGGWYVTGRLGAQSHLGNLPLRDDASDLPLRSLRRSDLQSLGGLFDTSPYPSPYSDVVALLVLEHQKTVQNLLTRVNYKIGTVMSRVGERTGDGPATWADVNARDQHILRGIVEPLVEALFRVDAAPLRSPLEPSTGFAARFSSLGPHDSKGRSLRELQLQSRVFRYPLSYLIYSEYFDALPDFAARLVRERISAVLRGEDARLSQVITPADRRALIEILSETTSWWAASSQRQ